MAKQTENIDNITGVLSFERSQVLATNSHAQLQFSWGENQSVEPERQEYLYATKNHRYYAPTASDLAKVLKNQPNSNRKIIHWENRIIKGGAFMLDEKSRLVCYSCRRPLTPQELSDFEKGILSA